MTLREECNGRKVTGEQLSKLKQNECEKKRITHASCFKVIAIIATHFSLQQLLFLVATIAISRYHLFFFVFSRYRHGRAARCPGTTLPLYRNCYEWEETLNL